MALFVMRWCRQRIVIALLCFAGLSLMFMMRQAMAVTMDELLKPYDNRLNSTECSSHISPTDREPQTKRYLLDWGPVTRGAVDGCFFWGYVVTQVPAGVLSQRYGGATVMGLGLAIGSLLSMVAPLLAIKLDWIGVTVYGISQGYAQGAVYTSVYVIVAQWIPENERSTWGATVFSGAVFGNLLSALITRNLVKTRWDMGFYVSGMMGHAWCLVFALLGSSNPDSHPYLSPKERQLLEAYRVNMIQARKPPWRKMFVSKPVWAFIVGLVGRVWMFLVQGLVVPRFMRDYLMFPAKLVNTYLVICYALGCVCGIVSGRVSDILLKKNILSRTSATKIFTVLSAVVPSACLLGASYTGCGMSGTVVLLIACVAFMGLCYSSLLINPVDLSPNYAGTIVAVGHALASVVGFPLHYLFAVITASGTIESWRYFMWITFSLTLVTSTFFIIFTSSKVQYWDRDELPTRVITPPSSDDEEDEF